MEAEDKNFKSSRSSETDENLPANELSDNDSWKYKYEENRLNSFHAWPAHYPANPSRLAKSGFFSTGKGDEVICFSCGGHINNWQFGDIVQKKHKELFPKCDFINNKSDNVPFLHLQQVVRKMNITENVLKSPSDINFVTANESMKSKENMQDSCKDDNVMSSSLHFAGQRVMPTNYVSTNDFAKFLNSDNILQTVPNLEELMIEEKRLETFKNGWPLLFLNPVELAKAGFFYLGYKDKVQCAFCLGIVSNWEANDIPIIEHSRHFPSCKFVIQSQSSKLDCLNHFDDEGHELCENTHEIDVIPNTHKLIDKTQQHTELEELGIRIYRGPMHPRQATFEARIRSFHTWPEKIHVQKEELAAAGFFYIGQDDHTKCFHCDGGLCCWETDDDPWVEHARWFRNCSFVYLNKGDDFIRSCTSRTSEPDFQKCSTSQSSKHDCLVNTDMMKRVEESMKTDLIDAVLKTNVFPADLIKAAVLKQFQEHGCPFSNVDEICEAASLIKERISMDLCTENGSSVDLLSNLNRNQHQANAKRSFLSERRQVSVESDGDDSKLKEENKLLKDQRLCKVCMDRDVGVVFLPCGHLLTCTLCAPALNNCPGCRQVIRATVKTFLS